MTDPDALVALRDAITAAMDRHGWPRAPLDLGGTEYGDMVRQALNHGCEAVSFRNPDVDRAITLFLGPEMTVFELAEFAAAFVPNLLAREMGDSPSNCIN